jgi:small conductance mechanosensitive channel
MFTDILRTIVLPIALRLLLAAVIWVLGRWLARRSQVWLTKSLKRTDLTESLITLTKVLFYYGIMILTVAAILAAVGVPISAVAGALGVITIVIAITLQQSLGNLASTVIILLFKPFKVGDVIETDDGTVGVVHEIQPLSTVLESSDGKTHIVPNGRIQSGGMANYSTTGILRLNLSFGISYDSDLEKAKELLASLLAEDERVLTEPPARVFVGQLADSYLELVAWPFAKREDVGVLQAELTERVMHEFDAAGIEMPYPRQDVHLFTHNPAALPELDEGAPTA